MNVTNKPLRHFSEDDQCIGAECPICGNVLKLNKTSLQKTIAGFWSPQPIRCKCGEIYQAVEKLNNVNDTSDNTRKDQCSSPHDKKVSTKEGCIGCFALLVIAIVISVIIGNMKSCKNGETDSASVPGQSTSSTLAKGSLKTTKEGYLASPSKELLDKAAAYLIANDDAALQQMLDTERVFFLKAGVRVYIVDTKVADGLLKLRPEGRLDEFWTQAEAVE